MWSSLLALGLAASSVHAWLPADRDLLAFNQTHRFEQLGKRFKPTLPSGITKIRGVNFGGWLIAEKWMTSNAWANVLQCGSSETEFDCMLQNYMGSNRAKGNQNFENHWASWITPSTVDSVHAVGLNTIRIPIGYWSLVDIVDTASEPFADGNRMLPYLDAVVQRAAQLGIYVIIDFHGAPGGQQEDAFTGQHNVPAGFFNAYNYGRAEKWLTWMTNRIHTNPAYSTVGMIEVLNEPVSRHDGGNRYPAPGEDTTLTQVYYPAALKAVRDAEAALGISDSKKLHVQFMSSKWDSGDARTSAAVANDPFTAFDDHNYIGFALPHGSQTDLMHSACTDSRVVSGQAFEFTGEWSLVTDDSFNKFDGDFFRKYFTAQQQLYETPGMDGWVFWTWKTDLDDPRWTYSFLTALNYIPTNAVDLQNNVFQDVCAPYR
ncbi:beta-1,6-glucanase [Thozetella sp. PMI_491]|nr:beta-1,6-glucanase [Thozetella sp. PMI_491]